MQQVTLDEAIAQLPDLIKAAVRGEEVLIAAGSDEVVKLVPLTAARKPRQAGSAKGMIWMAEDFDAPLEDFREYME